MCFFVGNDFLPHLPSLEIREGAIDRLVNLYKDCVYKTGGFVTDSGDVNLNRVQLILNELGKVEDEIFKNRHQTELDFKQRNANRKRAELQNKDKLVFYCFSMINKHNTEICDIILYFLASHHGFQEDSLHLLL